MAVRVNEYNIIDVRGTSVDDLFKKLKAVFSEKK